MYARPGGMDNFNNEGFAIAPQAECVGRRQADVLRRGQRRGRQHPARRHDQLHAAAPGGRPTPTPSHPDAATGDADAHTGLRRPQADRTAPSVKLALKLTKTGTYAVRKTGKFAVTITLGERADLTISATARKNAKAKARTILKATTRKGVAAGKPTLKLSLTSKVRRALRKGETLTLTVVARDAAGNATTTKVSAKVK